MSEKTDHEMAADALDGFGYDAEAQELRMYAPTTPFSERVSTALGTIADRHMDRHEASAVGRLLAQASTSRSPQR